MNFANPAGLALLGLAIPVVLTHILRPRRLPVTVSSTMLWRRLERPVAAATPWQRLRWSLLLLAQLLAVVGLALAVSQPQRTEAATLAQHTVFIVDASGSMSATDGSPDRLADATARAVELRGQLPAGGLASLVIAGDSPRVAVTASPDAADFERALRTVDPSDGHPDFADAFALAESLDTGAAPIGYVFLTDGGVGDAEAALLPPGTQVETVGADSANRAVTNLMVDSRSTGLHARVTVLNAGGPAVTQTVRVDVDGTAAASQDIALEPGQRSNVEFDIPDGDRVEAFLEGGDALAGDDHAVAVSRQTTELRVLLAGDTLFWQQLLASIPGVVVETSATSEPADGFDLAIYNGVDVPAEPGAPFVAVAPPRGLVLPGAADGAPTSSDQVVVDGSVDRPAVALVRTDDALLDGLDLADVAIASAQRIDAGNADVLLAGEGAPLLVRGQYGGQRFAYFSFGLRDSNLAVQVAFPLLAQRLVDELSGVGSQGLSITVGERLPVPLLTTDAAVVTAPGARTSTVEPGQPVPRARRAGFYTIAVPGRADVVVAANRPADESVIAPVELTAPAASDRATAATSERSVPLLHWVLWPLLAVLALELFLSWRNVGVTRRQWYLAAGLRVLVAALVAAAIVNPVLRRPADRVASVFVVDRSASVGAAGLGTGGQFVQDALADRPDSDVGGVVVFGGDSRVDQVMGDATSFGSSIAVVDAGATDVEAGLRLGAALLPADARRRVVLVSDGRPTVGETSDQLDALVAAGIPVDVVTLDSGTGADVAVAGIDLPTMVRGDETVPVVVQVQSSTAVSATVILRRDGVEVDRQVVDLRAGTNDVTFQDQPGDEAGAVLRYEATVQASRNSIDENDNGFAAVAVEGPARVLVVEGTSGEADTLVAALNAGGVGTEVVGVGNIPRIDGLIAYAGIVLVDVDARTLTGEQIDDLTTAVRDLGRGLVTIGGERSYGLGGYRDSPLSDLLPVDSDILDPQRRRTVAEVLSIDTSESMGACHCSPNGAGATEGGTNKTDISRAAAERTIGALSASDEVGVLAWNSSAQWVVPLQALPSSEVIETGLRSLQPAGNTNLQDSLSDAADALIASDAELKHIILFTDGFTDPANIEATADQAAELFADHGITVSVLATGEGAAPALEDIAVAGHGRFYAGSDLADVPQIMAEEAVIASRDFINEGSFLPEVTSNDDVVAGLTEAPPLLGYVATTAKGQAQTLLRIGPDSDPLLATWQAGLGRVTSWTSDTTNWSQTWASWDGYVDFFSGMVKDTLPAGDDAGAVQASVRDGQIHVTVESADGFDDGTQGVANVAGPDGQSFEVTLDRTGPNTFEGVADAPRAGTYAVGATVTDNDGAIALSSSTLASNSYPAEYVPGNADPAFLGRLATTTGGRTDVTPAQVWDANGLAAGHRLISLLVWLLLAAALLWPLAVVLSRLSVRGATATGARHGAGNTARKLRALVPKLGGPDPGSGDAVVRRSRPAPTAEPTESTPADEPTTAKGPTTNTTSSPQAQPDAESASAPTSSSTVSSLLDKKHHRRRE